MPVPIGLITSFIPASLKEKLADSLVELLAGSAERLGGEQGDQIAGKIRKFSSRGQLLQSVDCALEAGMGRFIEEYTSQDEDLVDAIQGDELFWRSEVVQDALVKLVSRPGAWLREERETVLQHFETVLPQRVNRERVDKAVSFLLRCIAEELWSLPGAHEIREAYSIQFQEISAEAQREQVALARQQLQATTQMNADLRQALLQLIGLVEQKLLAAPARAAMLASPRPHHNLPQPTYTQFVGRDEELAWLRQRLSPDDPVWQIAITGIGGVGKSALALAIAHEYRQRYEELSPEERFEAIVWVSAKEEVLTAFGREPAEVPEQVLHKLEDVYTAIARVLEREDITRAQAEEQNALVKSALKRQRTLLIMDNLESVKDDRIKAFLRNLPHGTKAIITSRESLDVADVKPLTGLRWEEAEALIEEECRVREVALTSQQRKRIFELTSGLPLPIKLGIARMVGGESFALVDRWLGDAVGELPEYCVKGQIDLARARDPNAWMVLLACTLFDRSAGASREALGEIAALSLADRDKALAHLQRLFLVNRTPDDRFWLLPIVQRYANVEFADKTESQSVVDRWLDWLVQFVRQHSTLLERDTRIAYEFDHEYPNLLSGIRLCRSLGRPKTLYDLAEGTWDYTYRAGAFVEMNEIVQAALDAANTNRNERQLARVSVQLSRLAYVRGQYDDALLQSDHAALMSEQSGNYRDLAVALALKAYILSVMNRLSESEAVACAMLRASQHYNDTDLEMLAADRLAAIAAEKGNYEPASEWVDIAEKGIIALGATCRLSSLYHRRGYILIREGRFREAEAFVLQALESNHVWRERQYVAANKTYLAFIYANTERLELARRTAEEAFGIYDSLGMRAKAAWLKDLVEILYRDPPGPIEDWFYLYAAPR
jgi:hypothetical protein